MYLAWINASDVNSNVSVDALAIWNRALSDAEISELYNSGDGLFYNESPTTNPHLEVGTPDGTYEWNFTGEFNQTNNRTSNLFSAINSYLSGCTIQNGFCLVPFLFHSDTIGILKYLDMLFSNDGFGENSQTFDAQTVSLSTETFSINLTYDSHIYNAISAN